MAFLLLSGVRISSLLSLQIQHIDIESRMIFQDARVVKTKNREEQNISSSHKGSFREVGAGQETRNKPSSSNAARWTRAASYRQKIEVADENCRSTNV